MAKTTAGTVGFTGVPSHKTNVNIALTENMSGMVVAIDGI